MREKNGFTLIELLAIIVILAIIAVITVPIILNIIENSRKGAATNSAFGYVDAVDKHFLSTMMDGNYTNLNGTFSVSNGKLSGGEYLNEDIPASGTLPTSGTLTYSNNVLQSGCLVIGEYAVTFNPDKSTSTVVGDCSSTSVPDTPTPQEPDTPTPEEPDTPTPVEPDYSAMVSSLSGSVKNDGYKYLATPEVVYYNPATGEKCSDYSTANSAFGISTGCMKWYAYSVKDNIFNMILDHNINTTTDSPWISSDDYSNGAALGSTLAVSNMGSGEFGRFGNHNKGPLTTLSKLKTLTNSWVTGVQGNYSTYTAAISDAVYSINYSSYKTRLITAQELTYILGKDSWDEKTAPYTSYFYFGSKNSTGYGAQSAEQKAVQRSFSWLFDNLYLCSGDGCENSSSIDTGNYGYWTSTPVYDYSEHAWGVDRLGYLYYPNVSYNSYGVRPVINVDASIVF